MSVEDTELRGPTYVALSTLPANSTNTTAPSSAARSSSVASDLLVQGLSAEQSRNPLLATFRAVIGDIPFKEPNVREGFEDEDLLKFIEKDSEDTGCCRYFGMCLCCLTGIGACYMCSSTYLINRGEWGFSMNSGRPEILLPGWHILSSPVNSFSGRFNSGDLLIKVGPITIIRVPQGQLGFSMYGSVPEILLPGIHVRNNNAFRFQFSKPVDADVIEFGPVKFLTVKSGGVRICYSNGKVKMYPEGRYAINNGTFVVSSYINTQQQNLRFSKHSVLLDGGISLLVEGLLTYQVVDVEQLIHQLGDQDLQRAIQDITKAELARVFASLHLEQISQASMDTGVIAETKEDEPSAVLGKEPIASKEGETRMWICAQVIRFITPITGSWGVKVINFQLESTKIADDAYAREYEEASLAMAKAKANLRAVNAQNQIRIQTARASAEAVKIEAEGKKAAIVIEAEGNAQARKIEAEARNQAAVTMSDPFAKDYAMANLQVDFARNLKAEHLTVVGDTVVGRQFGQQRILNQMVNEQS